MKEKSHKTWDLVDVDDWFSMTTDQRKTYSPAPPGPPPGYLEEIEDAIGNVYENQSFS